MSYSEKTLSSVSKRVADVRFRNKSSQFGRSDAGRRANVWKKILDDVCDQCSLHGLNHIVGKDRSTGEKSVSRRKIKISINMYINMGLYILGTTKALILMLEKQEFLFIFLLLYVFYVV